LSEVADQPNITTRIKSIGGHSGKCVELKITSKKDFKLKIPAGTLYYPADEGEQTLVAPIAMTYIIKKNVPRTIKIDGYCTESSDRSPKSEGIFSLGLTQDTALQTLVDFISKYKIQDKGAIQEAVWCVTDDESIANVHLGDPAQNKALRSLLAKVTRKEIPWHSASREIETDEAGNISTRTTTVFGNISFANPKPRTIQSKVVNAEGVTKFTNGKSHTIPIADNVKLNFEVSVSGWKKGNYSVIYYDTEGVEILKKEFVI
jgi:hypothetical protein